MARLHCWRGQHPRRATAAAWPLVSALPRPNAIASISRLSAKDGRCETTVTWPRLHGHVLNRSHFLACASVRQSRNLTAFRSSQTRRERRRTTSYSCELIGRHAIAFLTPTSGNDVILHDSKARRVPETPADSHQKPSSAVECRSPSCHSRPLHLLSPDTPTPTLPRSPD